MKWIVFILVLCILPYPFNAHAELSISLYEKTRTSREVKSYVIGIGHGFLLINEIVYIKKGARLFCLPELLSLDGDIVISLLEQEIRSPSDRKAYAKDMDVDVVLYKSFISRFPCN